jgi:protoheme IX farnesyltransferase
MDHGEPRLQHDGNVKEYLSLTKPGIVFGNIVTAAAGFFMASRGHFDLLLFAAMLIGLSLVIGAACVCNNYLDREMDRKMYRTRNRPLAKGTVPATHALVFAALLGCLGTGVLYGFTNPLTALSAWIGVVAYVAVYGLCKYRTVHGTLIGSVSGAIPPVVGYVAVSGSLDLGAGLLFLIVVCWQMPHFFAIAMVRLEDYRAAGIPVLPLVRGLYATKVQMVIYTGAFGIAALLPLIFGYAGRLYGISAALLGVGWVICSLQGFSSPNERAWARKMFLASLGVVMGLSFVIAIDSLVF